LPALAIASALSETTKALPILIETFKEGNEMLAGEFASCRHVRSLYHCLSGDKYPSRLGIRGESEGIVNGDVNAPGP
jgi:hypothetical protein